MPGPRRTGATAATLVALEAVSFAHGTRPLLDEVTAGVLDGARIGVVGRNGGGKTTLLQVVAGVLTPDAGTVRRAVDVTIATVAQDDDLPPGRTVRQVVVGRTDEHVWASDARVRDVLAGLLGGLSAERYREGWTTVVDTLSGGERRRVSLAAALVRDPDVLLLDEPTNHLDVEGIAWLARHVAARRGASVVVTHDRWFLDAACTETWEVADGRVHRYDGGYAAYVLARAERARVADVVEQRRESLLRKELAWLRRGAPARTSKPRFRVDAAEALIAAEPAPRDRLSLQRLATARLGRQVYDLEHVTLAPARDAPPVLVGQTLRLGPGDRIGLLGPNGAGKTTLLRLLADGRRALAEDDGGREADDGPGGARDGDGVVPRVVGRGERRVEGERDGDGGSRGRDGGSRGYAVLAGHVGVGLTVVPALLAQHIDVGDPSDRVLPSVERLRTSIDVGKGREVTARSLLEGFGFRGDRLTARLGDLSGGEARRLELLRLLVAGPNVLLLDEPTNDLDVETLTVLEDLLDTWPGTLVVVSHDRYFLERTTDTVFALLGDGRLRHLPGGVEEYLRRRSEPAADASATAASSPRSPADVDTAAGAAASGTQGQDPVPLSAADLREARKELTRIERRLDRLRRSEADLHDRLAAAATDHVQVLALDAELRALTAEREDLETRWLDLAEHLE